MKLSQVSEVGTGKMSKTVKTQGICNLDLGGDLNSVLTIKGFSVAEATHGTSKLDVLFRSLLIRTRRRRPIPR